jgi:uncharacterized membrane protein YesL
MHKKSLHVEPTAYDVIWLSCKQLFKRLPFWIRTNFWFILVSLPILTLPGANAALHDTIAAGLRDPGESRTEIFKTFKTSFFRNFWRSLIMGLINIGLLIMIIVSVYFWVSQESLVLNLISIIALFFFVMWFLCQPFLYPVLISHESTNTLSLFKEMLLLVGKHPLVAFAISLTNTFLTLIGVVLLGPVLLIIPAFTSMISIQCYWFLTGQTIPDWVDPVEYEKLLSEKELKES